MHAGRGCLQRLYKHMCARQLLGLQHCSAQTLCPHLHPVMEVLQHLLANLLEVGVLQQQPQQPQWQVTHSMVRATHSRMMLQGQRCVGTPWSMHPPCAAKLPSSQCLSGLANSCAPRVAKLQAALHACSRGDCRCMRTTSSMRDPV